MVCADLRAHLDNHGKMLVEYDMITALAAFATNCAE